MQTIRVCYGERSCGLGTLTLLSGIASPENDKTEASLLQICASRLGALADKDPRKACTALLLAECLELPSLKRPARIAVREAFSFIRSRPSLCDMLPQDFREEMDALWVLTQRDVAIVKAKGDALDRMRTDFSEDSVSETYPLQALVAGVKWPPNVVPHEREQYLDPEEFFCLFKKTKETFRSLPAYVREREKRAVGLW